MKKIKSEVTRLTQEEKYLLAKMRQMSAESEPKVIYQDKTYNEGDLYFILPDAHYPMENKPLMKKVFKCIKDNPPKGVCISGDWLDLFTLGSYNADSLGMLRDITLTEEYEAGLKGIKDLEKVLPKDARRMFLFGNHEDRYFREMNKRDNGKYGTELKNPIDALKLNKYGYEVLTNWKDDYFMIGDLAVTHGVYCNIHTAAKHLQAHGGNIMFGHTHRIQTHFTKHHGGFNIGCLADIDHKAFTYMPRMQRENWSNGFAAVRVVNGKAYAETIPVRSGGIFTFNGKMY